MRVITLVAAAVLLGCVTGAGGDQGQTAATDRPAPEYPVNELFDIQPTQVVQGDKRAWVVGPDEIRSTYSGQERTWRRQRDLSGLPDFQAPNTPILEAVTRMALEEALLNILPSGPHAGAFSAGAKWPGVWTRDISYAIHLSLAWILPEASRRSLLVKTNQLPEVIQDTGTGGSWPVSTDRTVWSLAAWELYLATGDRAWLQQAYTILTNTALRDRAFAHDALTGTYRGETSFMDWREQTYPRWMSPVDIAESRALGTNVLHWNTLRTLRAMGEALGAPAAELARWTSWAAELERALDRRFWLESKGYYSAYEYGVFQTGLKTDKSDTLANSLGVLLGAFPQARASAVTRALPVVPFGPPIIYPQIPNIPPYHNRAIWPFVTAYYSLAAAMVGNLEAFAFGLRSNLRAAALFLTHKENMVFANGHHQGTQVNSDRQLWSVAGWLAQVYRGLLGIQMTQAGLRFQPTVPEDLRGPFLLRGLSIRGATIDLTVSGTGDVVRSLTVDGVARDPGTFVLLPEAGKRYVVEVAVGGRRAEGGLTLGRVDAYGTRDTRARASLEGSQVTLRWEDTGYQIPFAVYESTRLVGRAEGLSLNLPLTETARALRFSVQGQPEDGEPANLSNYTLVFPPQTRLEIPAVEGRYPATMRQTPVEELGLDRDYLDLEGNEGESVEWTVDVPRPGLWVLRFRYGNGSGPISTDNKCALRTVLLDGREVGKAVFPQTGNWTDRLWSVATYLRLTPGRRRIGLTLRPDDRNMDGTVNQVVIDSVELILFEN